MLIGFTDNDWARSYDDIKSTYEYVFYLGINVISWCSRKHSSVALSSVEAEYIATNEVVCKTIWLRRILSHNMPTITMTKNLVFHARSNHIELSIILSMK